MFKRLEFLFFVILSLSASGQDSKWYFSLNMGKSITMGAFSETPQNNLNAGFAQNGFVLSLESNYALNENLSLKGSVLLNTNNINRLPLWTNLNNRMNRLFPVEVKDQEFISLTVNPWVTNSVLIGPDYTFIFNNLKLDFYVIGGLSVIYLPQSKLIYQNPTNNWTYINRNINSKDYNYGFSTGTSLRYPVSERFDFRIGFSYFYTKCIESFEEVRITKTESTTVLEQLSSGNSSVPVSTISASVGLVYYLK
jgi:hypothetical protein